jgi:hypothetical protein
MAGSALDTPQPTLSLAVAAIGFGVPSPRSVAAPDASPLAASSSTAEESLLAQPVGDHLERSEKVRREDSLHGGIGPRHAATDAVIGGDFERFFGVPSPRSVAAPDASPLAASSSTAEESLLGSEKVRREDSLHGGIGPRHAATDAVIGGGGDWQVKVRVDREDSRLLAAEKRADFERFFGVPSPRSVAAPDASPLATSRLTRFHLRWSRPSSASARRARGALATTLSKTRGREARRL